MADAAAARAEPAGMAALVSLAPLPTASERAADVIRANIFEGHFLPGTALPETTLSQHLQISRNTVREALRLLMSEHLLAYEPHKGVSVRRLDASDVRDIYASRRLIELSAIDQLASGDAPLDRDAFAASLADADRAAAADDWRAAGTANLRFHRVLVQLHGSARVDAFFQRLMTEMRLGFLALPDLKGFHAPYLTRNHELVSELERGEYRRARDALADYLDTAGAQVAEAVAER